MILVFIFTRKLMCALCNLIQYPVHSLVVFNSDNKAIPVAWIIAPRFASSDLHRWMRALYNRVRTKDPTWKLAGFIVDDPLSDVLTIRLGPKSTTLILDMAKYMLEVLFFLSD